MCDKFRVGYNMLKSIIYIVNYNGFFNLMFEFTLWNHGGLVNGYDMAPHTFTLSIQRFCSPNNSAKKCSFATNIIPELMF